ncbi:hypothetical protein D3C73_1607640 [compost metagenome]
MPLAGSLNVPATALRMVTSGLAAMAPSSKPTLKSVTVGNSMPMIVPSTPEADTFAAA